MAKPTEAPALDPASLPGPETILRRPLDNGMTVLARENFASPSIVLSGYVDAGAILDDPEQAGLADLTAASLMRGTATRSFREIYDSIESIGASLNVGAGAHRTSFQGKALAEDLGLLLSLLADVLMHPSLPKAQVEKVRAEHLTGLAIREQDTNARAHLAFSELAYPDHPYAIPSDGYRETVSRLGAADARRFHRRHYGPAGMVISVVGAVARAEAAEAVEAALGGWNNPGQQPTLEPPSVAPPGGVLRRDVRLDGKIQSDVVLGTPGPPRSDPDYLAAAMGNNVLGRFGMMGRIGEAVREAAGLAYYAYSSVSGGHGPGPWTVSAGVNPANVERAIELIRGEILRFTSRPITTSELSENQANFIGRLPLQLESNEGVAGALVHLESYALGLDYYQRYPGLIAALTRAQVLEAARRFLHPDRLAIGVAGPAAEAG